MRRSASLLLTLNLTRRPRHNRSSRYNDFRGVLAPVCWLQYGSVVLRNLIALLIFLPLVGQAASGPDPQRDFRDFVRNTWSLEAGLPQRSVTAVAEGPEGYLWVGTQQALARFDGQRFHVYTAQGEAGLRGNEITSLYLDTEQRLWIGSLRGLSLYQQRQFVAIGGPSELAVKAITETPGGEILVASDQGLFQLNDMRLERLEMPRETPVGALLVNDDSLWIGLQGYFLHWPAGQEQPRTVALPESHRRSQITALALHDDVLWLGSSDGLLVDAGNGPRPADLPDKLVNEPTNALLVDSSGSLWLASDSSLLRIHDDELLDYIDSQHPNAHEQVRSLYEDREGNLWLGSAVDGLARYWSGWVDRFSTGQGLSQALVWSVAEAGEVGLWVGHNNGLALLRDGQFDSVVEGSELPHPHAYTLFVDDDLLWIGTRRGLATLSLHDHQVKQSQALQALDAYQINAITTGVTSQQRLIGTSQGLYLLQQDQLSQVSPDVLGKRMVRQILVEGEHLMVVTDSGAFTGTLDQLQALGETDGLPGDAAFMALHRIDDDLLVLGSMNHGLFVGGAGQFRQLSSDHGLPSDSIYYLSHDARGDLWAGGFRGLMRLPLAQLREFVAGGRDQVSAEMLLSESGQHPGSQQGYCCNGAGHAKGVLRGDLLWLPTRDGVVRLNTATLQRNPLAPRVHIERLRIENHWQPVRDDAIARLPIGARNPGFEIAVLSYQDPDSVLIRYRLQGFEADWLAMDSPRQNRVTYTNLPPGEYRFEVIAANNAGVWTSEPIGLTLQIPARFVETLWFRLLLGLLLAFLLAMAYRWRRYHWRLNQQALEQKVTLRTEELRVSNQRLRQANRALQDLSQRDALTGLHNRRYLHDRMLADPAHVTRLRERLPEGDLILGFALIDIDHFKQINDRYGHPAGDRVLQTLGERLQDLVRDQDYAVRWGGEEFLVVFRGIARRDSEHLLENLRTGLVNGDYELPNGQMLALSCSIGFAELPVSPNSHTSDLRWEDAVEIADLALYEVKSRGRNGWAIVRPGSGQPPEELLQTVREDFAGAVQQGRIELRYQAGTDHDNEASSISPPKANSSSSRSSASKK